MNTDKFQPIPATIKTDNLTELMQAVIGFQAWQNGTLCNPSRVDTDPPVNIAYFEVATDETGSNSDAFAVLTVEVTINSVFEILLGCGHDYILVEYDPSVDYFDIGKQVVRAEIDQRDDRKLREIRHALRCTD
jgi:hypothetical protein